MPSSTPDPQQQIAQLQEQVAVLTSQLAWFKRHVFGVKSEKQIEPNPFQVSLFADTTETKPEPITSHVKAHKRSSIKKRDDDDVNEFGLRFDDSVPTKIIDVPAPELKGSDADDYEIISYKETTRLAQQPGSYTVLIYRQPVVRQKSTQSLQVTPAPSNVLEGCYCDVSLLAGLMVDKAVYHLPLYRQHQRMLDSGIKVSRATLTNWIMKGIELLRPIYRAQWTHLLLSKVLAMDEVPIKAGRKSLGKMKQTYYWPIYGEDNEVAFTWSSTRGSAHAIKQLTGFSGTLLTDGYAAYNKAAQRLNKDEFRITQANCWAHTRRMFERALDMETASAQQALAFIGELYDVEDKIRKQSLDLEATFAMRAKHSEPIATQFFNWVYEQRQRTDLLPSNPLSKALVYASERSDKLKVYLCNPNVQIDTNHVERALRVIPMGRKNYLFCWSELGAEQLGILQSLMVTCRLHDINPYTYLVDVMQRVSEHPASDVLGLTPREWKVRFADSPMRSNLSHDVKADS